MGVDALLVLDEVRDVDRLIGEMTIPDPAVRYQRIVPALKGLVFAVRPDSYYKPAPHPIFGAPSDDRRDMIKPDRVFVSTLSRYWYPGESPYSAGNWHMVSRICQILWAIEPGIVVQYRPEPDSLFDMDTDEVTEGAHCLTPECVAELDKECARAEALANSPEARSTSRK
ncbi:hypothetical protein AB0876_32355 [Mycobacterium sp. NPDC049093]